MCRVVLTDTTDNTYYMQCPVKIVVRSSDMLSFSHNMRHIKAQHVQHALCVVVAGEFCFRHSPQNCDRAIAREQVRKRNIDNKNIGTLRTYPHITVCFYGAFLLGSYRFFRISAGRTRTGLEAR